MTQKILLWISGRCKYYDRCPLKTKTGQICVGLADPLNKDGSYYCGRADRFREEEEATKQT